MNGISSNLKDEIKKSKDSKHKEKFKFIAAVLVTNIMVTILCLPMTETPVENKSPRVTHPDHQMITLPLNVLVSFDNKNTPELAVSLVTKDKVIIAEKAWLHELVKKDGEIPQFKIEINNQDVIRVSEYAAEGMIAVPYVQKKTRVSVKRGSRYEVSI